MKKIITVSMAKKIFETGLSCDLLKRAYLRDPENGLKLLLSKRINGKSRVTNKKAIINSIKSHFVLAKDS
jgi:hypothetical protein